MCLPEQQVTHQEPTQMSLTKGKHWEGPGNTKHCRRRHKWTEGRVAFGKAQWTVSPGASESSLSAQFTSLTRRLHHLCSGHVASETARRIQLALPKKGPKAPKVFKVLHKTMLPRCLLTGCSSASIQKLMTQGHRVTQAQPCLPSDLTPNHYTDLPLRTPRN